ncbi:MAG TPA: heparan-alpha-glucosaminide N-acetyltransferase domain-containing protein [Candidatus Binatia bacterium]|nr:heparan-alpha-glucosaminide N-acetyltransferase domain-containing protein [Candidatus Binatia bacterium]
MSPSDAGARLRSLDAFRGLTVAAMIFVNNPGTWRHVYPTLRHAEWNGCTVADLVFPFFLFIVGVAITFSFATAEGRREPRAQQLPKLVRRTLIIFALGLFLNGFPFFTIESWRIPGVLQRIALCYGLAALAALLLTMRGQAIAAGALLLGYWGLIRWVPIPGYGAGQLQRTANLPAYIDELVLRGHMFRAHWDPEGILSTVPAVATTLGGVLTGHWLRSPRGQLERVVGLFVAGNFAVVLGLVMNAWLPINKDLWTSSYAVFTGGVALNLLALCYWLIEVQGCVRWAVPFFVLGTNPILAYLLPSLLDRVMITTHVTRADGSIVLLKTYVFETCFLPWASRAHASVLYATADVLMWMAILSILYRRRIFIKI